MKFRWNEYNRGKLDKHGVSMQEAEHVVRWGRVEASTRHPEALMAIGTSPLGRRIQVAFVLEEPEDEPYEGALEDYDAPSVFVFHAMPV